MALSGGWMREEGQTVEGHGEDNGPAHLAVFYAFFVLRFDILINQK